MKPKDDHFFAGMIIGILIGSSIIMIITIEFHKPFQEQTPTQTKSLSQPTCLKWNNQTDEIQTVVYNSTWENASSYKGVNITVNAVGIGFFQNGQQYTFYSLFSNITNSTCTQWSA